MHCRLTLSWAGCFNFFYCRRDASIELECGLVVSAELGILMFFAEETIAHH